MIFKTGRFTKVSLYPPFKLQWNMMWIISNHNFHPGFQGLSQVCFNLFFFQSLLCFGFCGE